MRKKELVLREYPFLEELIEMAKELVDPEKIVLFGSRARGDHRRTSDFDIAFFATKKEQWGLFSISVDDDLPTLASFDLVDMDLASADIKDPVAKEGVVLYERNKN